MFSGIIGYNNSVINMKHIGLNYMKTHSSTKYKFVNAIWITGKFNDESVLGRTCINNGLNSVAIITESGSLLLIPFDEVKDLKKLSIIGRDIVPPITSTLYNKADITIDERLIVEVLKSINTKN